MTLFSLYSQGLTKAQMRPRTGPLYFQFIQVSLPFWIPLLYWIFFQGGSRLHGHAEGGFFHPDPNAGFVLSSGMVQNLAEKVDNQRSVINEYSMDAHYELAKGNQISSF